MKTIDAGVFIPVGNHGWIHSTNAPVVEDASFPRLLEITKKAEELGFDFVLSPSIWRGLKGPSEHWMRSLESVTTSAALLQATNRIHVFATVHMTVHHPAVIAKMMATLDQIGPGRVGINLVTGSSYLDLSHLGLWRGGLNHDERYDLGDEWTQVVRRLWSEKVVTHKGKFFELNEAKMGPKPSRRPRMVNAGSSSRGFKFAAENCDIALIAIGDDAKSVESGRQAKVTARALNRPELKVNGLFHLIPAETDEEAQARLRHFDDGVDVECLEDIAMGYSMNPDVKEVSAGSLRRAYGREKRTAVNPMALVGSYASLSRRLAKTIIDGELDGITLVVPDYVEDLHSVAMKVLMRLPEYGVSCRIGHD